MRELTPELRDFWQKSLLTLSAQQAEQVYRLLQQHYGDQVRVLKAAA